MICFPDTSFLCSVYREQVHSPRADAFMATLADALPVSTLLLLEFRQSVRLQARMHAADRTKGYSKPKGDQMLRDLQTDLTAKVLLVQPVHWPDVHQLAERLSATYTASRGHRLTDVLHVATALHLGVAGFLTFDVNQRLLAESEGMTVAV